MLDTQVIKNLSGLWNEKKAVEFITIKKKSTTLQQILKSLICQQLNSLLLNYKSVPGVPNSDGGGNLTFMAFSRSGTIRTLLKGGVKSTVRGSPKFSGSVALG